MTTRQTTSKGVTTLSESTRRRIVKLLAAGDHLVGEDQVVVVVLGGQEGLVSRTKARGRVMSARELRLRLAGAEVAVDGLIAAPPTSNLPQLTAGEGALLDAAGFREGDSSVAGALERSRIELELLLRESRSLVEAAKSLGVSTGRLRQRLSQRTLYGIKEGRAWRLPRFQFDRRGKPVRGIDKVLPHVRHDAHPLAIANWFSTPHQDLVVGDDEEPVTPLDWLSSGRPAGDVAELSEEI
jgi:hypothetical protein